MEDTWKRPSASPKKKPRNQRSPPPSKYSFGFVSKSTNRSCEFTNRSCNFNWFVHPPPLGRSLSSSPFHSQFLCTSASSAPPPFIGDSRGTSDHLCVFTPPSITSLHVILGFDSILGWTWEASVERIGFGRCSPEILVFTVVWIFLVANPVWFIC